MKFKCNIEPLMLYYRPKINNSLFLCVKLLAVQRLSSVHQSSPNKIKGSSFDEKDDHLVKNNKETGRKLYSSSVIYIGYS